MSGDDSIRFILDGKSICLSSDAAPVLADALRECGVSGVRVACDHGVCGACTVLVNGRLTTACSTLSASVDGMEVATIASAATRSCGHDTCARPAASAAVDNDLHPVDGAHRLAPPRPLGYVQQAFIDAHAFQCGMCTPGMITLAETLLARDANPGSETIRSWMSANVCRCTGYAAIEAAVKVAARSRARVSATSSADPHLDVASKTPPPQSTTPRDSIRRDDLAKVSGEPMFTVDMTLAGLAEIKVLRSPHAHARIVSIDTTAALAIPGVHAVITGADVATLPMPLYGLWIKDQPVLAIERVRYIGDPVAAVAACDAATALRAIAAIAIDYAPLPVVNTTEAALADGAPTLFDQPSPGKIPAHGAHVDTAKEPAPNVLYSFRHRLGDCDAIFRHADHVFEDEFAFSRMSHIHLEPLVTLARPLGDGVEVWSCNQDPFLLRQDISEMFGLPEHRIRVHTRAIGGGFGAKSFCKVEPLAVLLALRTGRPVRLSLSMDESLLTLSQHAARLKLTTAVSASGRLLARRADIVLDAGAYADASALVADKAGYRIGGPYRWEALDSLARAVRTNTVPAGSFRGFGGTQASWASESQIDMIARRLGLDPVAMRQRNLLRPGEPYRTGDSAIDCDLSAGLAEVAARIGWQAAAQPDDVNRPPYLRRGKGVAIGFKDAGGQGRYAQARVKVTSDGHALISCATVDMGQGAVEAFRRIVSEVLALDPQRIERADIDTDQTAFDQGTHASSATAVTGEAVRRAAIAVRDRILTFAAKQLAVDMSVIDLRNGHIVHDGCTIPLVTLVRAYYGGLGTEFVGEGEVKVETDARAALNAPIVYWMPNWTAAEVEVDVQTGRIAIVKLVSAADAGHALVPDAVHGQIAGAAMQGLGQALFERLNYGEDDSVLRNGTPQQYRVPMASDLPAIMETVILEHGLGRGPLGAKGVGEAGILGVCAAIANAVEDAVGIRLTALPMTPDAVLAALDAIAVKVPPTAPLATSPTTSPATSPTATPDTHDHHA